MELRGERPAPAMSLHIVAFLESQRVLRSGMSILDLGCASGTMLRLLRDSLKKQGAAGRMTGLELALCVAECGFLWVFPPRWENWCKGRWGSHLLRSYSRPTSPWLGLRSKLVPKPRRYRPRR